MIEKKYKYSMDVYERSTDKVVCRGIEAYLCAQNMGIGNGKLLELFYSPLKNLNFFKKKLKKPKK